MILVPSPSEKGNNIDIITLDFVFQGNIKKPCPHSVRGSIPISSIDVYHIVAIIDGELKFHFRPIWDIEAFFSIKCIEGRLIDIVGNRAMSVRIGKRVRPTRNLPRIDGIVRPIGRTCYRIGFPIQFAIGSGNGLASGIYPGDNGVCGFHFIGQDGLQRNDQWGVCTTMRNDQVGRFGSCASVWIKVQRQGFLGTRTDNQR